MFIYLLLNLKIQEDIFMLPATDPFSASVASHTFTFLPLLSSEQVSGEIRL